MTGIAVLGIDLYHVYDINLYLELSTSITWFSQAHDKFEAKMVLILKPDNLGI